LSAVHYDNVVVLVIKVQQKALVKVKIYILVLVTSKHCFIQSQRVENYLKMQCIS